MATCPKGHTSTATDYCDECGAPMTAAPAAPSTENQPAPDPTPAGDPCPECGTPRSGRFCEVCGHDYAAVSPPAPAVPDAPPAPAAPTPSTSDVVPATWRVVAAADRAYFDRVRAAAEPGAEAVEFPAFCPQRRFDLTGEQVLVGRRSRSRGVEPGIDLTGPPEDAGVSHMHALFVAGQDGFWSIVDLDSANGTYLNDSTEPLAPNQPVWLAPGDRVHVGGWTTLTVVAE